MNSIINKHPRIFVSMFFALVIFLLFYGLDMRSFRLWDEARVGVNALNMLIDKNYFYTTYQNAPDFWNTKPHLLILLQVFSMKLFGLTEGSVRLPSAIAAFFSCGLVYYWVKKENRSRFYACLAVLVFISTRFLSYHGARAGDYESLLILWELCYCYALFAYMQTEKLSFLWIGFITLTLAVLTKGIAGLLFTPGIALFALFQRKWGIFFKCKSFYAGILFFMVCIVGYYWLHEMVTPGYLQQVVINEMGGRYFNAIEGHQTHWWYYFYSFTLLYFYFFPILLINLVYLLLNRTVLHHNAFLQYVLTLSLTFFVVISLSKTQLGWYAYPLYPFAGMLIAILSQALSKNLNPTWRKKWLVVLIAWMMISYIGALVSMLAATRESESISSYLKHHLKNLPVNNYKLVVADVQQYDGTLDFYIIKYFAKTQHHLEKTTLNAVKEGDWVIMQKDSHSKKVGVYKVNANQFVEVKS